MIYQELPEPNSELWMSTSPLVGEEFCNIPGHPHYEASSYGRIFRKEYNENGRHFSRKVLRLLSVGSSDAYYRVTMDGRQESVHRLVALAFHIKTKDADVVDHINRNKHDNTASNLRWVTYYENSTNCDRYEEHREELEKTRFKEGMERALLLTKTRIPKLGIRFNLANPRKKTTSIKVIITNRGKVYRKSIGLSVPTSTWRNGKTSIQKVNESLNKIATGLHYALNEQSNPYEIEDALSHIYNGRWNDKSLDDVRHTPQPVTFYDYFKEWSERPSGAQRQKISTFKNVFRIMGMCDWEDIDERWYTRFVMLCDKEKYSRNFTGIMIGRIKTVLHEGKKLGYHDSDYWREMKKFTERVENVALTKAECELIINFETDSSIERKAIDLFILGYKTGARFSDVCRLTTDSIHDGRIQFVQQKTAEKVEIPASPMVVEVLSRNGGKAPKLSQQQYNKTIKSVAKKAGVTDTIEVVRSEGAGYIHEYKQKCDMISSHTARRSCITQLHFSGVPAKDVMTISGHKRMSTLENYIKSTREESVKRLCENEFFK